MWKAPEAMNSMWSVLTMPYLVLTVQPSTSGSRSRCTPSRETSAPMVSGAPAILSISSMKTMPFCSAFRQRARLELFLVEHLGASSSVSSLQRIAHLELARAACARRPCSGTPLQLLVISSMPGGAMISTPTGTARSSISISRSSSSPSRSILRNFWRVSRRRCSSSSEARCVARQRCAALLGGVRRARAHLRDLLLAGHLHGDVDQVADDRVHVAADVADLGELRRLDLDEGRARQLREAARDLGLADAGRADHQDVLGRDLLAQRLADLHAAPAVAQRDRHRALGRVLADDVLVQFLDDLARRHRFHAYAVASSSMTRLRLV